MIVKLSRAEAKALIRGASFVASIHDLLHEVEDRRFYLECGLSRLEEAVRIIEKGS